MRIGSEAQQDRFRWPTDRDDKAGEERRGKQAAAAAATSESSHAAVAPNLHLLLLLNSPTTAPQLAVAAVISNQQPPRHRRSKQARAMGGGDAGASAQEEQETQEQKRAAAAAYDYEGDARWADYWSNVLVPPHLAAKPEVQAHFRRKFYQRFVVSSRPARCCCLIAHPNRPSPASSYLGSGSGSGIQWLPLASDLLALLVPAASC
jgi:hypothetical protein